MIDNAHKMCYNEYTNKEGVGFMATTNVTIRIDKELKAQADELFAALGLNMSTAIGVFCRQAVRLGKIPFELAVDVPNAETLAAIDDVNNNRNMSKAYDDVDELMRDLNA
jgi:DNA-damage-inducible protein J